jgi:release factor glutamine methyltransferase
LATAESAKKVWTILDMITWGTGYLTEKKIDDARLTIELLLSHVLKFQRIQLYTKFDQPLSEQELGQFKALLKRRLSNEPLQYITGETEFLGLKFFVEKSVLIPRPETELLVDQALKFITQRFPSDAPITILDLGTGSGCIAVSLAVKLPSASVTAVDISPDALAVAARNAERNGVQDRVHFLHGDIHTLQASTFPERFHCILANPPYISSAELLLVAADVKEHEPLLALTDNANGLTFYPEIAHFASAALTADGFVGVEHAYEQSDNVLGIFTQAGFSAPKVVTDFQGVKRHLFFLEH